VTSRLSHLRARLAVLQRSRRRVRAVAAWAALASAVILALAGVFALDLVFALAVPQRAFVLLLAGLAVGWAFWRFSMPLLRVRENEIDTALVVERQNRLDSQLVAALQFEQPGAEHWGSPRLVSTVVEQVAAASPRIDVFHGFSKAQLGRRLSWLAACLVVAAGITALWPGHVAVFANRLLLGSRHYPTRTQIECVIVNRTLVLEPAVHGQTPLDATAAQGRPVTFLVHCRGELPGRGVVFLTGGPSGQQRTRIALAPLSLNDRLDRLATAERMIGEAQTIAAGSLLPPWREEVTSLLRLDAPAAASALKLAKTDADLPPIAKQVAAALAELPKNHEKSAVLAGELGRLNDGLTYRLRAGDAWTDAATLSMIPLPAIEVRMNPVPPKYAASSSVSADSSGRQLAVLEGSAVDVEVECVNRKRLESVWLTLTQAGTTKRFDLAASDAAGHLWKLPTASSPLARVREELRYEIQALDADGLSLETPIRGAIRIRPDLPPTAVAEVVHRVVLPSAAPVIGYRASDDFGLVGLAIVAEVERMAALSPMNGIPATPAEPTAGDESPPSDSPAAALTAETHRFAVLKPEVPLAAQSLPLRGQYALPLTGLKLAKGDRVKLTLEATDYRGENEQGEPTGLVQSSEPLVLEISDESGVLAAIAEADPRSEEQLNEIIKRQLGIGEESQP
jgi:hypothetical protein